MNIFHLLNETARRFAGQGAVYLGTEQVHTWRALRHRAAALATGLRGRWPAGSRVAMVSENCVEYLELMFGVWAADAVIVPLNAKLHPREVAQIIADAGVCCVFASVKLADKIEAVLSADAAARACAVIRIGSPEYQALFVHWEEPQPTAGADSLAWLFYTSGTTGRSKGAMLSHRNLMAMTLAHLADVESIDEGDSQVHAAPMSHGSGLYVPAYVSRGARQVIPASGSFDPAEFIELCSTHPGCGAFLAPTMVQRLRLEAERSGCKPTQLRSIVYGGGPMYVQELKQSLATFGPVFAQIYGQGESPMTITALRREEHMSGDDAILGSVGWARTGCEVLVVGSDGKPLPAGETGEIICRGDVVMAGYWDNPEATGEALRAGWLYTGDMGALDARGFLTLRDRSKDVIISGGSNIYPREVEEALLRHGDVQEICVVGRKDEEWGEVVVAFVVLAPGAKPAPDEFDRHCLEYIARFKRPKQYHFLGELPKNNYGKVLKRVLRERIDP